jgi:hypothetical protein
MTIQQPRGRPSRSPDGRPDEAPALSVIVPTRNEAANIQPLLAALGPALAGLVMDAGQAARRRERIVLPPELALGGPLGNRP